MNDQPRRPLRWLITLTTIVALALPALPAMAQTTTGRAEVTIDAPTAGETIRNGIQIDIGGWAVNRSGPGTGIDEVRVYLDGPMDGNGTRLGTVNYGGRRPDVAQTLGNPAFTNSGFDFLWTPTRLSGGSHALYVYAHAINDGWSSSSVSINVDAPASSTPSGGYGPEYGSGYGYGPQNGSGYGYAPDYGQMPPYGEDYFYDGGGQACIMIYPPPPGCGGPIIPPPPPPPPYLPPIYPGIPPVAPGTPGVPGGLGAPTNVVAGTRTGTTVTLIFTPVAGATSYRVYQSVGLSAFVPATLGTQTPGSVVVTGLTPSTTYTFYVAAVDANGLLGLQSMPVVATTGPF
jgi:hypothetical protein